MSYFLIESEIFTLLASLVLSRLARSLLNMSLYSSTSRFQEKVTFSNA